MAWRLEDLELRARALTRYLNPAEDPILFGVECQLALVAQHLHSLRERHTHDLRELVKSECDITTDIMRIQDVRYLHFISKQRAVDGLKTKLLNLDSERRRMQAIHDAESWRLQERLLMLFIEREHLKG